MKLLDVNLLLYAVDERSAQHELARAWFDAVLSEARPSPFPGPDCWADPLRQAGA